MKAEKRIRVVKEPPGEWFDLDEVFFFVGDSRFGSGDPDDGGCFNIQQCSLASFSYSLKGSMFNLAGNKGSGWFI